MTRLSTARGILALVALALLPACGSDSSPTPPSTTPPTTLPPPTQTVVASGSGALPVLTAGFVPFTTATAGHIDVTVDWTFATNDVDVYLVRGECTFEEFVSLLCSIVSFSESTTAKPERLSYSGATAGVYHLVVANFGPADESVAFQVVLTSGPGVFSASTGTGTRAARARRLRREATSWTASE
jgi:hypothetical protein